MALEPSEHRGVRVSRRLIVAGVATVAGGIAIALLTVLSPGETAAAGAPGECLERWNEDRGALEYGRHNATFHDYDSAQVGYLPSDGSNAEIVSDPEGGACVVVFSRVGLDPEIEAAGQIYSSEAWTPLSGILDAGELQAMQGAAVQNANARPTGAGTLLPLE